ncbi:sugar phosphate isomerase/epimerase family protein [Edaphobacillus lindanitolerans]|uniref:Sugar phosphate isomerase/epimerase n=1 Tax=Edaphobacillus lindanitolerans TaxID=550447 RepID=A0A1U7PI85_9BACI|nr:sugar phosphate isomerase/epimerase family protein [Edaphobacillus lindanitolerans]SIT72258.1 Sugar phosphate isomerase/epimerase [Edaphobacillus lindanitolerans]
MSRQEPDGRSFTITIKLANKVGIITDNLRLPVREALEKAKEIGADGVQMYAVGGELEPSQMSPAKRRELSGVLAGLGLEVSALCGDLGGHGFQDPAANRAKIEKSKRIIDLAKDLGADIVTTHIGIVPDDESGRMYAVMQEACEELGAYAKSVDGYFAIETGPETAVRLKRFLDSLSGDGVSVNYDPANLVMVTGDDPVRGVHLLKEYIVHTHVKDGVRLAPLDPREVYGMFGYNQGSSHNDIAELVESGAFFREVPLGEGSVGFDAYFRALAEIGYDGYLTVEREVRRDPVHDLSEAVRFINQYRFPP